MKKLIKKVINLLGFDVVRIVREDKKYDTDLYLRLYNGESVQNRKFYNIGAGAFYHPCWTNIDYESEWYSLNKGFIDIQHDLFSLSPIPVESNSAEIIYSSHTVEHISNEVAQNMFNESFRMLKMNGIFRITTPNIDLIYRAFKENDKDFFYWIDWYVQWEELERIKINKPMPNVSIEQIFLHYFAASVSTLHSDGATERIDDKELNRVFNELEYEKALDYCISKCPIEIQKKYPGNHINWWNKDKMLGMLRKAGFNKIFLSGYGQSFSPVLRNTKFFDCTHPKVSLYVEAFK